LANIKFEITDNSTVTDKSFLEVTNSISELKNLKELNLNFGYSGKIGGPDALKSAAEKLSQLIPLSKFDVKIQQDGFPCIESFVSFANRTSGK